MKMAGSIDMSRGFKSGNVELKVEPHFIIMSKGRKTLLLHRLGNERGKK